MPELPDVELYRHALERTVVDRRLERLVVTNPFLLRSVEPPPSAAEGRRVVGVRRLGKRIVLALEKELYLVLHLMIAGRLRWRAAGAKGVGRIGLAAFEFSEGTLHFTEAGSKRRASLHLVQGTEALAAHDPGGLEVLEADLASFRAALARENHTLKRALTSPRLFSGIGNAYSDEILHRARLSPFKRSRELGEPDGERLFAATCAVLSEWSARLIAEYGDAFPEKVTAFREGMAVHGRFREPCPDCGAPVQRVVTSDHEMNYCAPCQTEGRLLADRALSRLLREDWPKRLEDWER